MSENIYSVLHRFYDDYVQSTPKKMKMIDAYLLYIMLSGIVQFVYCCLVGTFPFNSFLSGFISCVGSFVLAGMQHTISRSGCVGCIYNGLILRVSPLSNLLRPGCACGQVSPKCWSAEVVYRHFGPRTLRHDRSVPTFRHCRSVLRTLWH